MSCLQTKFFEKAGYIFGPMPHKPIDFVSFADSFVALH